LNPGRKRAIVGVLVAAVGLTAATVGTRTAIAGTPVAVVRPGDRAADPAQDGYELFLGAFFLVGPQADVVAKATAVPPEVLEINQAPEAVAYVERVAKKVAQLDPSFYAEFSTMLRSGNPFSVEQGIAEGRQIATRTVEALGGAVQPPSELETAGWFLAVVAMTVAAAASALVGVNVVLLASHFWVGASPLGDLEAEEAIAILTEAFAA
jgi:SdpC family antimicrobial peptide